jgi:hypothetical protein
MILEVEHMVQRLGDAISLGLVEAALQIPADDLGNEAVVTHVIPNFGDGDLVEIEGIIDLDKLARFVVDELGLVAT